MRPGTYRKWSATSVKVPEVREDGRSTERSKLTGVKNRHNDERRMLRSLAAAASLGLVWVVC
eukprot:09539_1